MIEQRLNNLRKLLKQHNLNGYIVPTLDEYLSEYAPDYAKRLEYITGFTGSNGLAVILQDTVLFFTDGRYINQCFSQLDDNLFEVFDQQLWPQFNWSDYIADGQMIGYDPKIFTTNQLNHFSKLNLQPHSSNLIDEIWEDQPAKPNSAIYDYPVKYAGEGYNEKIAKCRDVLEKNDEAEALVITNADSVCWLLNIRAHDVEFSPLLLANAIITKDSAYLFADVQRLDATLNSQRNDITILPESEFESIVAKINGKILFDQTQCSSHIASIIKKQSHQNMPNPIMLFKACKNDAEIKYMQEGHVQDAVAVCELLAFIEQASSEDLNEISEYDIGEKLTALRAKGNGYIFDSFPTICGYQENGAIIHYRAQPESAKKIIGRGLLLIDSGGQYMGATTDITRVISIGAPTTEHKKYYTKVLKGHIALARAIFPKNKVSGAHLDILARQYLWQSGDDYAHGTGHGVGSCLSVHEGPQNISLSGFSAKLQKGMVTSNEPGYYVDGEFGIRIENMMYVQESENLNYLSFKMLTLVPYAKNLIDLRALDETEQKYLHSYCQEIKNKIHPLLSTQAKKWLDGNLI
ncbi:aminopeptidase P family protein [Rickettsiaceae bacterium]|nr:aminopeptidase P family protein [Rickettsiaceae bacterium]